jgi:hypothetical protein
MRVNYALHWEPHWLFAVSKTVFLSYMAPRGAPLIYGDT